MKNKKLLLVLLSMFFMMPIFKAELIGIVNDSDGINLRTEPTNEVKNTYKAIPYNSQLTILDKNTIAGPGCSGGWYKVSYDGKTLYACSNFISVKETSSGNTGYVTGDYEAKVNTSSYISVKTSPSYSSTTKDKIITGTRVKVIEKTNSKASCEEGWLYVSYHDGREGYVCGDYIRTKEELTLNESEYTEAEKKYAEELSKKFPATYIPYLMRMHRNHPNWIFTPYNTNISWNELLDGEQGKNKIESTTTTVLNYYIIPGSSGTEGGNWYYVNDAVNAYFMDPRNFLSETFIFTFENVKFNKEVQTKELIKSFFKTSYLSQDEYVGYFMEAANTYGVSPLHLAARVSKEGGDVETYGPVSGSANTSYSGCNLNGYYNYYNIGAYSNWTQGLYYAAGKECDIESSNSFGRPWKTRRDAILGGANFIASQYVNENKNTLYFQKFNVVKKTYFTGQYMSNIMAPTQEGENIYDSLKKTENINASFEFIIPIYNNMPENVSLPNLADTDTSLSNIKIDGKTITGFDPDVIEYTHYVIKTVDKITLNVTPTKSTTKVDYKETIELKDNETRIEIKTTSQSGDTKTYKIIVKKVDNVTSINDILSKLSVKVNGTFMKNISEGTSSNSLIANIKKADPTSTVVYKDSSGKTITNAINLRTGDKLEIKSSNGETKVFDIVVNGDVDGDGLVTIKDLLRVQKHILKESVLTNAYKEAGDTDVDNNITIKDLLRVQKHILKEIRL